MLCVYIILRIIISEDDLAIEKNIQPIDYSKNLLLGLHYRCW
jgi:hypothetical protein